MEREYPSPNNSHIVESCAQSMVMYVSHMHASFLCRTARMGTKPMVPRG